MIRVALTGGIATGKSHCLARLMALGFPGIDADVVARSVVERGQPALEAVVVRFGKGVIDADGTLDRDALGRVVFADAAARHDLEAIIHPLVYPRIETWFSDLDSRGTWLAIAEIPLLYETGREADFDRVIVSSCPDALQLSRLGARGISEADARRRLEAQWPIAEKTARADYVIDTSGTFAETDRQIVEVRERLIAEFSVPGAARSPR